MNVAQRTLLAEKAEFFVKNNNSIGYDNKRPFALQTEAQLQATFAAQEQTFKPDCATAVANLYFLVPGLADPLGFGFKGFGNTETARAHLKAYTDPKLAHRGALVIFGIGEPLGNQHMAMVTKQGSDPDLFSHGSSRSSIILPYSEEQKWHGGETCFLDVGGL